jgi:hypothetical protein
MAKSYVSSLGNGTTTDFTVTFPFIARAHVHVFVGGVDTAFTWINDGLIRLSPAPGNGVTVKRQRMTPTTPLTDFVGGSTLNDQDLNRVLLQAMYVAEEALDAANDAVTIGGGALGLDPGDFNWDAQGHRIKNVGTPVASADAATKSYVDSAIITGITGGASITNLNDVAISGGAQYQMLRMNGALKWANEDAPYDICVSTDDAGKYGAGQVIVRHAPVRQFVLKASLTGSRAGCVVAPTSSATIKIKKNGSDVGSINIAGAATTATFTFSSDVTFTTSDTLTIVAPASADATLAGIFAVLKGIRQ